MNMKLERRGKGFTQIRCGILVLIMNEIFRQLLDWLNKYARLRSISQSPFTLSDMYRYVAVLLCSHTTGLSFDKALSVLRQAGSLPPL